MNWMTLQQNNKNMSGVQVPGKVVTREELRQHKTMETGVWTSLKGNVYNITPYLEYHPGGIDELMKGAGKDCTCKGFFFFFFYVGFAFLLRTDSFYLALFNKKHAWVNYEAFLKSCYVGPLEKEEL
jgi:cytochrome-b5 reductase